MMIKTPKPFFTMPLLLATVIFTLTGCGSESGTDAPTQPNQDEALSNSVQTVTPGEQGVVALSSLINVNNFKQSEISHFTITEAMGSSAADCNNTDVSADKQSLTTLINGSGGCQLSVEIDAVDNNDNKVFFTTNTLIVASDVEFSVLIPLSLTMTSDALASVYTIDLDGPFAGNTDPTLTSNPVTDNAWLSNNNYAYPDGYHSTAVSVTGQGTASAFIGENTITFTPNEAQSGYTRLTYLLEQYTDSDGNEVMNTQVGSIDITVTDAANTAPLADDFCTIISAQGQDIDVANYINDPDPNTPFMLTDADSMTGDTTLTIEPSTFNFAPHFDGNHYLSYTISDGDGGVDIGEIEAVTGFTSVFSGATAYYAIDGEGNLWVTGQNKEGQLGLGYASDGESQWIKTQLTNIVKVAGGSRFALALDDNGIVWATGDNSAGQLGFDPAGGEFGLEDPAAGDNWLSWTETLSSGDYSDIGAGEQHSYALQIHSIGDSGTSTLWSTGLNDKGQLGLGDSIDRSQWTNVNNVSGNTKGYLDMSINNGYINTLATDAGASHSYATTSTGTVITVGSHYFGQQGVGTNKERNDINNTFVETEPTFFLSDTDDTQVKITHVAAGNQKGLALGENGNVWSVGLYNWGATGLLPTSEHYYNAGYAGFIYFDESLSGENIVKIATSLRSSYALTDEGRVYSTGWNRDGQLGRKSGPKEVKGTDQCIGNTDYCEFSWGLMEDADGEVITGVKDIAAQGFNVLLVMDQSHLVEVAGEGYIGIGEKVTDVNPTNPPVFSPLASCEEPPPPPPTFTKVEAGTAHGYALDDVGNVWAVGDNSSGQLGLGDTEPRTKWAKTTLENITMISAGSTHGYALDESGNVWAVGNNQDGQLGLGDLITRVNWTKTGLTDIDKITAGGNFGYALKSDAFYVTGDNSSGQLGFEFADTAINSWTVGAFVYPYNEYKVADMRAGYDFGYIVANYSWWSAGSNQRGQLGRVSSEEQPDNKWTTLTALQPSDPIALGGYHMYIYSNFVLKSVGDDGYGQLSRDSTTSTDCDTDCSAGLAATLTSGSDNITPNSSDSLAGGLNHGIAIANNGVSDGNGGDIENTVWVVGRNSAGQLGLGDLGNNTNDVSNWTKTSLTGATAIAGGGAHSYAIVNGEIWATGNNTYGQLGQDNTVSSSEWVKTKVE